MSIRYWFNVAALPLYFLIVLASNLAKLNAQAVRWSWSETRAAYVSNRRYWKKRGAK